MFHHIPRSCGRRPGRQLIRTPSTEQEMRQKEHEVRQLLDDRIVIYDRPFTPSDAGRMSWYGQDTAGSTLWVVPSPQNIRGKPKQALKAPSAATLGPLELFKPWDVLMISLCHDVMGGMEQIQQQIWPAEQPERDPLGRPVCHCPDNADIKIQVCRVHDARLRHGGTSEPVPGHELGWAIPCVPCKRP